MLARLWTGKTDFSDSRALTRQMESALISCRPASHLHVFVRERACGTANMIFFPGAFKEREELWLIFIPLSLSHRPTTLFIIRCTIRTKEAQIDAGWWALTPKSPPEKKGFGARSGSVGRPPARSLVPEIFQCSRKNTSLSIYLSIYIRRPSRAALLGFSRSQMQVAFSELFPPPPHAVMPGKCRIRSSSARL